MQEPLYLQELLSTNALGDTWDMDIFAEVPVQPMGGKLAVPPRQKNTDAFSQVICRETKAVLIYLLGTRPALNDDVS